MTQPEQAQERLTLEAALALPAGRELDLEVARVVFGQEWQGGHPIDGFRGKWPWPYPYSADIAAAWEVVEKVGEHFDVSLNLHLRWWSCHVSEKYAGRKVICVYRDDSAPRAICRAALKACWDK